MPGNVVQVHDRIWQIQSPFLGDGMVMLYVLRGSKLALVDTGIATNPIDDVRPGLKSLGLDLSDIDYVLNTHGHHDHLGGNGTLRDHAPNARIHLHGADKPFSESLDFHRTFMTEFLRQFGHEELMPERQAVFAKTVSRSVGVDRVLADGDRVDLGAGLEFTVLHTPGHTPGSVCYYLESEKLLLTGDSIQARGSRTGGWPLYFNSADYRASMNRLLDVPVETMAMGHGFHAGTHLNWPIRKGADARNAIEESVAVTRAIDQAVAARLQANPAAGDLEIAQGVVLDLLTRVPALLDPKLRLPTAAGPTLAAHIREARGQG